MLICYFRRIPYSLLFSLKPLLDTSIQLVIQKIIVGLTKQLRESTRLTNRNEAIDEGHLTAQSNTEVAVPGGSDGA